MAQLESNKQTHGVCLKMFNVCSISYSANVNAIFKFFACTPQLWPIDVSYALSNSFWILEATVATGGGLPSLSLYPIGRSSMWRGSVVYRAKEMGPASPTTSNMLSLAFQPPFCFCSDWSAIRGLCITISVPNNKKDDFPLCTLVLSLAYPNTLFWPCTLLRTKLSSASYLCPTFRAAGEGL
jgi:hypothetical protein